ncbi:MAG TPA: lipase maturation factor family protein [Terriglobales bacterium]|nr:lipase maturation factor family protein [Terriglobales bacterium]
MSWIRWLFDWKYGATDRLIPRWTFLRALGLIYFSAFYSLAFQIKGLIGPDGILPANAYLAAIARSIGIQRFWFAPTLLWISSGPHMMVALWAMGMVASILLIFNLWPRGMLIVCFVCFLSFVSAAQDFSGYQSDGMLLEAGFISIFFAPSGFRPRWGEHSPPSCASLFLLQWEWFRIYFESGLVKLVSGDPEWRHLTAMDDYYQNNPLPTWVGWYIQKLPHWFHWSTALGTLVMELGLVWMMFLPRRFRIMCFFLVTLWQAGVILSANYTFLNYLVLSLGFLLLDDKFLVPFLSGRFQPKPVATPAPSEPAATSFAGVRKPVHTFAIAVTTVILSWLFYATMVELVRIPWPGIPLPGAPVTALEPFRVANSYGLFAVMTRGQYEIQFQGSDDGQNWVPYPFRYKPQALNEAPGIYAPYQPRFDWNLWFASLGWWRDNMFVVSTEERLLNNSREVLNLFRRNPFPNAPPKVIRAVLWQYWFTSLAERRATGDWWKRKYLGTYAPTLTQQNGRLIVLEWPTVPEQRQ